MLTDLSYGVNIYMESRDMTMELSKVHQIKRTLYFAIKRVFDILCGIVGIILLLPISICVLEIFILYFLRKRELEKMGNCLVFINLEL